MELIVRVLLVLLNSVTKLLQPIYWFLNRQRPEALPALKNPLLFLSATEIAKKIRNREISSESVVESYIERIKSVNPHLNAVVENRFDQAIRDARGCDKKLEAGEVNISKLEEDQPLYGVPFTVKESCGLKGFSQTGCTLVRKGEKALEDGLAVESLKFAGAIPLCVTNTPELCTGFDSSNLLYGSTNNPYDTRRIAGGSSGGEGALIGAGASLIGIGSDIAGSIRVPCLFNGIFGHKPSPGIIPLKGHFPLSSSAVFQKYLVLGPMTRYCDDLILAVKIMSKKCKENLRLDEPVDIAKINVFHMEDFTKTMGYVPVSDDIKNSIKKAAQFLQGRGANVDRAKVDDVEDFFEILVSMFFCMEEMPQILMNPDDPKHEKNAWAEFAKSLFGLSKYTKNAIIVKILRDTRVFMAESKLPYYRRKSDELQTIFENMLGTNGVLLIASYISPALVHNQSFLKLPTAAGYCLLFNIFGFPSTQVPMGLNKDGLPIGFQVVAGRNQDRLCLAVAKELEKGFGGWIPPSSR